jgi:hypothetical protein
MLTQRIMHIMKDKKKGFLNQNYSSKLERKT